MAWQRHVNIIWVTAIITEGTRMNGRLFCWVIFLWDWNFWFTSSNPLSRNRGSKARSRDGLCIVQYVSEPAQWKATVGAAEWKRRCSAIRRRDSCMRPGYCSKGEVLPTPLYCAVQQWTAIIPGNRAEKEQGGCLANSSGNEAVWIHNTERRESSFCCYKLHSPLTTTMKGFRLQKLHISFMLRNEFLS